MGQTQKIKQMLEQINGIEVKTESSKYDFRGIILKHGDNQEGMRAVMKIVTGEVHKCSSTLLSLSMELYELYKQTDNKLFYGVAKLLGNLGDTVNDNLIQIMGVEDPRVWREK